MEYMETIVGQKTWCSCPLHSTPDSHGHFERWAVAQPEQEHQESAA